tara:strand:+ start:3088 stop:3480 length:393 start_codon:yes stop_codon:yes gene_type:complete
MEIIISIRTYNIGIIMPFKLDWIAAREKMKMTDVVVMIVPRSLPEDIRLYRVMTATITTAIIANIRGKRERSYSVRKNVSLALPPVILAATTEKNIRNARMVGFRSSGLMDSIPMVNSNNLMIPWFRRSL